MSRMYPRLSNDFDTFFSTFRMKPQYDGGTKKLKKLHEKTMNNNINDEKICACVRVQPILSMGRRDFEISNISSGRPKLETRILNIRVGAHRPKALDTFFSNVFNYKRQN